MSDLFAPFPKLARLSRECTITEKIDGTNAQVLIIAEDAPNFIPDDFMLAQVGGFGLWAGSRTRMIWPGKNTDNYGFARWVFENADELVKLGPGRHFGEWWGKGIQRGYGLDERCFSLFDTHKWGFDRPACCDVVPVLYKGEFTTDAVEAAMEDLRKEGSHAVINFMNPEGIVVYHEHARVAFKKTFDDRHKEVA